MLKLFAVLLLADITLRAVGTHLLISKVGNECFQLRLFLYFLQHPLFMLLPVRADWKLICHSNWKYPAAECINLKYIVVASLQGKGRCMVFTLYSMDNYILLISCFTWTSGALLGQSPCKVNSNFSAFRLCLNSFWSFFDVNTVNRIKNSSSGGARRAAYALTQHSSSSFSFFSMTDGDFLLGFAPLISHQRVTPSCLRSSDHVPLCHC